MTVHVVEDDAGVSDSLLTLLANMGHDAIAYPDAETFFRTPPPRPEDTVLVDLLLPGISGLGVIRWLEALRAPPRIVAMTGQSESAVQRLITGAPTARVLRKPLTFDRLAEAV